MGDKRTPPYKAIVGNLAASDIGEAIQTCLPFALNGLSASSLPLCMAKPNKVLNEQYFQ
jgi:hypothetical protein